MLQIEPKNILLSRMRVESLTDWKAFLFLLVTSIAGAQFGTYLTVSDKLMLLNYSQNLVNIYNFMFG